MNNLREMHGVRRIDRMRNESMRDLLNMGKGVNEFVNDNSLGWYGHTVLGGWMNTG